MTTQLTIKQVRKTLSQWGKFWRNKELGKHFGSQAVTESINTQPNSFVSSDMMHVPDEIARLTHTIDRLRPECIRALRAKYLMDLPLVQAGALVGFETKRSLEFWLTKAERTLMVELEH